MKTLGEKKKAAEKRNLLCHSGVENDDQCSNKDNGSVTFYLYEVTAHIT